MDSALFVRAERSARDRVSLLIFIFNWVVHHSFTRSADCAGLFISVVSCESSVKRVDFLLLSDDSGLPFAQVFFFLSKLSAS